MEARVRYDPERHHRKSIRLPDYDYRHIGGYFITLCTHQREMLFGAIIGGDVILNEYGHIVLDAWMETAIIRPGVLLDEFIVMPNHFHAIVFLPNAAELAAVGAHSRAPSGPDAALQRAPKSLGAMIAGFKSTVTTQINILRASPRTPVWQRNFYEHIIRDDEGLRRTREYISSNPTSWEFDAENPGSHRKM
jgi:putative transposase